MTKQEFIDKWVGDIYHELKTEFMDDVESIRADQPDPKMENVIPELVEAIEQLLTRITDVEKNTWDKKAVWVAKQALKKVTELGLQPDKPTEWIELNGVAGEIPNVNAWLLDPNVVITFYK